MLGASKYIFRLTPTRRSGRFEGAIAVVGVCDGQRKIREAGKRRLGKLIRCSNEVQ